MTIAPEVRFLYGCYQVVAALTEREFGGTLAGKLVLFPNLSPELSPFVVAAGIASAASLAVESDPLRMKDAMRRQICEFTVNSLDETIRILKNQLRKRQPVAVGLSGDIPSLLAEMLERGLQPDVVAVSGVHEEVDPRMGQFLLRGAKILNTSSQPDKDDRLDVSWTVKEAPGLWLPKIDALLEEMLSGESRVQWIRGVPTCLHRALQSQRFVRLSTQERDAFLAALRKLVAAGQIGVTVFVTSGQDEDRIVIGGP